MKFTRLMILTLLMGLLAFAGTANAQINTAGYCGDLSEADCDLLQTSWAEVPSATFDGAGILTVTVDGAPFEATMGMRGDYVMDTSLAEKFAALTEAGPDALGELYSDPEALVNFVTDYFQLVDSNMTLEVGLPTALVGEMFPADYALDLWLVDGVAYADLAGLSEVDPSLTGVYGIDLVALYSSLFNDPATAEMMDMMFAGDNTFGMDMVGDPAFAAEFSTLQRVADDTVNGVDVAVFETTVDYAALFSSDTLREVVEAQLETQREVMAEQGVDPAELETLDADAVMALYEAMFADATMTSQTAVGLEDGFVYQTNLLLDVSFDAAAFQTALNELAGDDADEMPPMMVPPLEIVFDFTVTQSGFGEVGEVTVPADATVLPSEMFGM